MAKYSIGAYTLDPTKPFKTMDEAVKFTQDRYPELSKEVIEKHINPKITENATDRSGGIHETAEEGGKSNSKADKRRSESNGAETSKSG